MSAIINVRKNLRNKAIDELLIIGEKVYNRRTRLNATIQQVADIAGFDRRVVTQIESGESVRHVYYVITRLALDYIENQGAANGKA